MTLPDKPSELLTIALSDLDACRRDERYSIHMDFYHVHAKGVCFVCLAGSVMAKTLNSEYGVNLNEYDFEEDIRKKLVALDNFRQGDIGRALQTLTGVGHGFNHLKVSRYENDPNGFVHDMNVIVRRLKEKSL